MQNRFTDNLVLYTMIDHKAWRKIAGQNTNENIEVTINPDDIPP
jgi:hypothetical protein